MNFEGRRCLTKQLSKPFLVRDLYIRVPGQDLTVIFIAYSQT